MKKFFSNIYRMAAVLLVSLFSVGLSACGGGEDSVKKDAEGVVSKNAFEDTDESSEVASQNTNETEDESSAVDEKTPEEKDFGDDMVLTPEDKNFIQVVFENRSQWEARGGIDATLMCFSALKNGSMVFSAQFLEPGKPYMTNIPYTVQGNSLVNLEETRDEFFADGAWVEVPREYYVNESDDEKYERLKKLYSEVKDRAASIKGVI